MEWLVTLVWPFLQWLWQTTLIASLVICLILAAQRSLGHKLGPRWSHALWLVLLIRMVVPWAPQSRISLLNLLPSSVRQAQVPRMSDFAEQGADFHSAAVSEAAKATAEQQATPSQPSREAMSPKPETFAKAEQPPGPAFPTLRWLLPMLWLAGAALVGVHLFVSNFALWRIVKRERPLVDQSTLELFEECKAQMDVQTLVAAVPSSQIGSPALFGFVRPRLLLPRQMLDTASRDEMRYVFLHELAHLKRHDIYLGWVTSLLQVLHWFNPLVWFAFHRMRIDREMACDALVLAYTGEQESQEYGRAIVALLQRLSRSRPLPAMAGILETKSQLERRIAMIAQFRNNSYRWSPLAAALIVALCCVSLPGARSGKAAQPSAGNPTGVSASQPEEKTGLAPDGNAPVAPQVTGVSATETASLGGGLVARRVLTDASGLDGVLTPDGKYISSMDKGTGDLVQFEIASGQTSRITNRGPAPAKGDAYSLPVYSRDGKQIAYASYTKENDGRCELQIRNLDGSGLRTLYSEKGVPNIMPVDWSPDAGSILAQCSRDKTAAVRAIELTLISTADGSVRVLKSIQSPMFWSQRASFSPDGQYVAFSFVREGSPPHGEVFLMTADGRNEVVVAGHPAEDKLLAWTPDGRSLVFLSDRSGTWDLWTVAITGGKQQGEPELLKKDFGDKNFVLNAEVLGFAPDGSFYYKTKTSSGRLYNGAVDIETGKVLVPPAPVATRYTGLPSQPTWSPDGSNLLYISGWGNSGPGILTIRSAATGEERFLSRRLRFVNQISWAPDGRSIIALGWTEKETGIFRIDAETGESTRLADVHLLPKLCPNGKTLVFATTDGGPSIRKRNLDTGEESEVAKVGRTSYDLSPDGREVVFQVDGAVKIVSLNGGEPRELFRGLAKNYGGLSWTRDGRYIIARARGEIWRVPAQGGTPLKLDLSIPQMLSFAALALHPDNRRFAFSVNEGSKSELWVLENFLPAGMGVKDSK
jgi:beta-lactamase regulating signal transducer with metallopeptidase domain/Tol biopolymer transport system component